MTDTNPVSSEAASEPPHQSAAEQSPSSLWSRLKPSDYMSFAALVISAATAFYNFLGWLQGPTISFLPPQLVSFRCYPAHKNKDETVECDPESHVMIAATNMTYVNEGRPEYGGIILDEAATMRISSRAEAAMNWREFSNVTTLGTGTTSLAAATVVPGSGSVAHETRFFPRDESCSLPCSPRTNYVPWKEFVTAVADPNRNISLVFSAKLHARGESIRSSTCDVFLSEDVRNQFRQLGFEKTNATSLLCVARPQ